MPQNKLKRNSILEGNNILRGWPGYRTRPGRSGYDPIDSSAEESHLEGIFLRNLFTLKLITRNPFYLFLMGFIGIPLFVMTLIVGVDIAFLPKPIDAAPYFPLLKVIMLLPFLIIIAITGGLIINLGNNLLLLFPKSQFDKKNFVKVKNHKKKLPRRRKDYK
jgi:hypothetical protein